MIEYCSKRILTISLVLLVLVSSVIFLIEESVTTSLRPQRPSLDTDIPCNEKQSFRFLTPCGQCNEIDKVACEDLEKTKEEGAPLGEAPTSWVACDPETFRDLRVERSSFVLFELLVAVCGVGSYVFVRRQHHRLDQRLVDRVNRQILSSS